VLCNAQLRQRHVPLRLRLRRRVHHMTSAAAAAAAGIDAPLAPTLLQLLALRARAA
jgi:hypothetical protein